MPDKIVTQPPSKYPRPQATQEKPFMTNGAGGGIADYGALSTGSDGNGFPNSEQSVSDILNVGNGLPQLPAWAPYALGAALLYMLVSRR